MKWPMDLAFFEKEACPGNCITASSVIWCIVYAMRSITPQEVYEVAYTVIFPDKESYRGSHYFYCCNMVHCLCYA